MKTPVQNKLNGSFNYLKINRMFYCQIKGLGLRK